MRETLQWCWCIQAAWQPVWRSFTAPVRSACTVWRKAPLPPLPIFPIILVFQNVHGISSGCVSSLTRCRPRSTVPLHSRLTVGIVGLEFLRFSVLAAVEVALLGSLHIPLHAAAFGSSWSIFLNVSTLGLMMSEHQSMAMVTDAAPAVRLPLSASFP